MFPIGVRITADTALWSRPNSKTHRCRNTYDIPTVSSIKELISCVYKKPSFIIVVEKLIVLNIGTRQPMTCYKIIDRKYYPAGETFITDVDFYVEFSILPNYDLRLNNGNNEDYENINSNMLDKFYNKHFEIYNRRLKSGSFFKLPYAGVKNAGIANIELSEPPSIEERQVPLFEPMFLSMVYGNESCYPKNNNKHISNFLNPYQKICLFHQPIFNADKELLYPNPQDLLSDLCLNDSGFVKNNSIRI